MTTIFEEEVTCAVCGSRQTVQEMGSTSSFGPIDLDTRPPPLQRGTMEMWVHECTECGFVAPELGTAADDAGRTVASADYRVELAKPGRLAALELFERAQAQGKLAMKSVAGGDQLLLADLARRAGEFEQALQCCDAGLAVAALPAFVAELLFFQRELVLARDLGAHTVAEVEATRAGNTVH